MCGIVGYTGKALALSPVLEGLRRLEYRGYDSAGIALVVSEGGPLWVEKRAGKLSNLESTLGQSNPEAHSGIGHTRWATHGGPTDLNAHPHLDNEGKLALIHNGIIENYVELRAEFSVRSFGDGEELDELAVAPALNTFGDVRERRDRRATDLVLQAEVLRERAFIRGGIDGPDQPLGGLPNLQFLKAADRCHATKPARRLLQPATFNLQPSPR